MQQLVPFLVGVTGLLVNGGKIVTSCLTAYYN